MRMRAQRMGCTLDCAYLRKGWGTPRWQIDGVGGGGCASIHDVEIWVSGWGELEGGKVTRSQLPVGCRIDDLDDPRSQLPVGCRIDDLDDPRCVWGGPNWGVCRGPNWGVWGGPNWGVWGGSNWGCRNSKTPRNRDFREVCTHLPFRTRCDTRVLVLGGFVSTYVATSQPLSQSDPLFQSQCRTKSKPTKYTDGPRSNQSLITSVRRSSEDAMALWLPLNGTEGVVKT